MSDINHVFDDLTQMVNDAFTYTPMSDEQYQVSCVKDIEKWAFDIASEWNGKLPGRQEQRSMCAQDIMEKCQELISLINEMEEL